MRVDDADSFRSLPAHQHAGSEQPRRGDLIVAHEEFGTVSAVVVALRPHNRLALGVVVNVDTEDAAGAMSRVNP